MKLSVIIPQYERWELTLACCSSLLRHQDCELELLVVDDGSSREVFNQSQRLFSHEIALLRQDHAGITKAWNNGISHAQGELIVLLNNDVQTVRPWMNDVANQLCVEPERLIGAADSTIKARHSLRKVCPWLPESIIWFAGWCLGFSRNHFLEIGPFDEGMSLYWSDTDWQLRHYLQATTPEKRLGRIPSGYLKHAAHGTTRMLTDKFRQRQLKQDREYFRRKWTRTAALSAQTESPST